jgi:hypothetical protein
MVTRAAVPTWALTLVTVLGTGPKQDPVTLQRQPALLSRPQGTEPGEQIALLLHFASLHVTLLEN